MKRKKTLWRRCLRTVLVLLMCRTLYAAPTPGVNTDFFQQLLKSSDSFLFLNVISGGGLSGLSIAALNITPYISATIFMQLLGITCSMVRNLQQGMEGERKLYEKLTLVTAAAFAWIEALGMAVIFGKSGLLLNDQKQWILAAAVIWTACSILMAGIGRKMEERKDLFIGNGISLMLLMNLLSSYPSDFLRLQQIFLSGDSFGRKVVMASVTGSLIFLFFLYTFWLQETEKDIEVIYYGKASISSVQGIEKRTIPVKLCPGSVIPVIFASSVLSFPVMISSLLGKEELLIFRILNTGNWFSPDDPVCTVGVLIYAVLIASFSYYYAEIQMNPTGLANELRKHGGMIADVRPGQPTVDYLKKQIKATVGMGAAALLPVAVIPSFISGVFQVPTLSFMGTSVLITVSIINDSLRTFRVEQKAEKYQKKETLIG